MVAATSPDPSASEAAAPPRVDERILGTGTTARFGLLMALILAATSVMTLQVAPLLSDTRSSLDCALAAGVDPDNSTPIASSIATLSQTGPYTACLRRNAPPPPWWLPVAWPLLVLVAGAGLFAAQSVLGRRRRRTVSLAEVDNAGDLAPLLAGFTAKVRPGRRPRFVVDPAAAPVSAVVFGRTGRPTVCLNGGLLAKRGTDPGRFRAVLMHEIAHIHNGDVTLTYLTVAVWRAFVVLTVLPHLVVTIRTIIDWSGAEFGPSQVAIGTRSLLVAGLLIALVTLARADVLRSREIYADLTAVRWGADPRQWVAGAVPRRAPVAKALARVTDLWHTHPQWRLRRDSLDEPVALFDLRPLPLALTGAAAMLVNANLTVSLSLYRVGLLTGPAGLWSQQVVALVTAGLIAGVVGIAVWRAVAYATLTGRARPSGARVGVWLGLGMAAAELATHRTGTSSWLPVRPEALVLVMLSGVVLMWWLTQSAELGVLAWRGPTLRPAMVIGLVTAGLAMSVWFAWWGAGGGAVLVDGWPFTYDGVRGFLSQELSGATADRPADVSTVTVVAAMTNTLSSNMLPVPLAPLGLAALWVGPMLAWLVRPRASLPPWVRKAILDDEHGERSFELATPRSLPRLRLILLPAAVIGMTCWVAAIGVRAATNGGRSTVVWQAGEQSIRYLSWIALTLVIAGAIAAISGPLLIQRFRLIAALLSAQAAVLVGFAGIAVMLVVDGCARPADSPWMVCHRPPVSPWAVTQSLLYDFLRSILLLVTVIAVVLAACFALLDRVRPPVQQRSTPLPTADAPVWRMTVVGTLCMAALAIGGVQAHRVAQAYGTPSDPVLIQRAAQQLLGTTDAPPSARVQTLQIDAWRDNGGDWLILHIQETRDRYERAIRDLSESGQATWQNIRTRLDPICAEFGRLSEIAEGYFRVPDHEADLSWRAAISLMSTGSRGCRQALDQQDLPLLRQSLEELDTAHLGSTRAEARMTTIEDRGRR